MVHYPSKGEIANTVEGVDNNSSSGWSMKTDANGFQGFYRHSTPGSAATEVAYIDNNGKFVFLQGTSGDTPASLYFGGSAVITADSASQIDPAVDATVNLGTSALRFRNINISGNYQLYGAASDANTKMTLNNNSLSFGPGGASALDTVFSRGGASVFYFGSGGSNDNQAALGDNTNRLNGVVVGSASGVTGGFSAFHASADANPTVQLIDKFLQFGAGGASAVDTSVSRLAANTLVIGTDNNGVFGSATVRMRNFIFGNVLSGFNASGDANPVVQIGVNGTTSFIKFGPGGGTVLDTTIARAGVGVVDFNAGTIQNMATIDFSGGAAGTLSQSAVFNKITVAQGGNNDLAIYTANGAANAYVQRILVQGKSNAGAGKITLAEPLVFSTLAAFVSGDKYLIVDASGNVHKSGLGPAS